MAKKITITVDLNPTGTTKVEAEGYEGTSCYAATAPFELALGGAFEDERKTADVALNRAKADA